MVRPSIAALILALPAFQASAITYSNNDLGDIAFSFSEYSIGQTFTLSSAQTLADWSFYALDDSADAGGSPSQGNGTFRIAAWTGDSVGTVFFSTPFWYQPGLLTFAANTNLAQGSYAAVISTVGIDNPILPYATMATGTDDNILPGGRFLIHNESDLAIPIPGNLKYSATFAPIAAVPEPGTCAMIISGFSIVGLMARRRRRLPLST